MWAAGSSSLLLLPLLLYSPLPDLSFAFSLKNCTITYSHAHDNYVDVECSGRNLALIPGDLPRNATTLNLAVNEIVRISKLDLQGLSKLISLRLDLNLISLVDDRAFVDLAELMFLFMSSNKLTKLTDEMFQGLSGLIKLSLSNNQISSISALAFQPLLTIRTIELDANSLHQITDVIPALKLTTLESLLVIHNQLSSFQSDDLPMSASNLTTLNLAMNPLTKFSLKEDVFPRLRRLSLESCTEDMEWDVANETFLRSLTDLSIEGTHISLSAYTAMLQTAGRLQNLEMKSMQMWVEDGLVDAACQISSLRSLVVSENQMETMGNLLLSSCSGLDEVILSNNGFVTMSRDAFRSMTQLRILSLSNNRLSKLSLALQALSTLENLDLSWNVISELDCLDFRNLTSLKSLNMRYNRISSLHGCVFENMNDLEYLHLGENEMFSLGDIFTLTHFRKLKSLNLHDHHLKELQRGGFSSLSSLSNLDVDSDKIFVVDFGAFEGLHDLESLSVTLMEHGRELFTGLPQLKTLSVRFSLTLLPKNFQPFNDPPFTNLVNLKTLTLKVEDSYRINFTADLLSGLKSLEQLMTENFFTGSLPLDAFKHTPQLRSLHIIGSNLLELSPELFWPLTNLTELDLSNNKLRSLDFLVEAKLSALSFLKLTENELSIISEITFQFLPVLTYLDLSGNPLICECSNSGFIHWITSNNQTQVAHGYSYTCAFPESQHGHRLLDFDLRSCWLDVSFLCFISTTALIMLVLLSAFVYHFLRFHLTYAYYLLLAFLYDKRRKENASYQYDAFISYNVHDEVWVYEELVPELEGQQGWKLCLHHRDFEPGRPIVENITDAIYSSRRTICVISQHYLQSEWCSREIQMASYRLFDEQKDVLILLFLEDVPARHLTAYYHIRSLVKKRSYLSWTRAAQHPAVFWQSVQRALGMDRSPQDNKDLLCRL